MDLTSSGRRHHFPCWYLRLLEHNNVANVYLLTIWLLSAAPITELHWQATNRVFSWIVLAALFSFCQLTVCLFNFSSTIGEFSNIHHLQFHQSNPGAQEESAASVALRFSWQPGVTHTEEKNWCPFEGHNIWRLEIDEVEKKIETRWTNLAQVGGGPNYHLVIVFLKCCCYYCCCFRWLMFVHLELFLSSTTSLPTHSRTLKSFRACAFFTFVALYICLYDSASST